MKVEALRYLAETPYADSIAAVHMDEVTTKNDNGLQRHQYANGGSSDHSRPTGGEEGRRITAGPSAATRVVADSSDHLWLDFTSLSL
jgi:hypothetical protein